ncbi:MAG: NAD(P)-binding domain-containing protein [Anaerolineae bacterium]
MSESLPVAVIGAGPVGLAAAVHLLERGETPIIFESGAEVGTNIRQWQHVRMFSPWEFTVDAASVRLLEQHGWQMPPTQELPTGRDLLEKYLLPLAAMPEVSDHLNLNARIVAVSRRNIDKMKDTGRDAAPFVLHVVYADGREEIVEARAVIDASGTWHKPNPLGSGGLPALGEIRHQEHIFYGIPDVRGSQQERYAGKRVMVVGSGHSALNALLDLAQLKQNHREMVIYWVMRGTNLQRVYGSADDGLPARGQLGSRMKSYVQAGTVQVVSPFRITSLTATQSSVVVSGETADGSQTIQVDEIIAATGARPDLDMLRELRLELDPALESTRRLGPMIDPNIHSCGTVRPHGEAELRHPEKDFYIVGMKSYGRAPTFLLATGYEQVRSVVAALVGDWDAARKVQLNLPETGVCSTDLAAEGSACCATPSASAQPALLSIGTIPTIQNGVLQAVAQPIALKTAVRDCGCDDDCCDDGVRSTSCGCGTDCCS